MAPVVGARDRPAGRPVADQEAMVAVGDESVALLSTAVTAVPAGLDWAPGLATVTVLAPAGPAMSHLKVAEPLKPEPSVAVTTTEHVRQPGRAEDGLTVPAGTAKPRDGTGNSIRWVGILHSPTGTPQGEPSRFRPGPGGLTGYKDPKTTIRVKNEHSPCR
jgi:hypothetical protein